MCNGLRFTSYLVQNSMDIAHDLQVIAAQEQALVFPQFDADRAWQIGAYLHEVAALPACT